MNEQRTPAEPPRISLASDRSYLVSFGSESRPDVHDSVRRFSSLVLAELRNQILNVHPGYTSVLISFNPAEAEPARLEMSIKSLLDRMATVVVSGSRTVTIPVCYGGDFGPDLGHVAERNRISTQAVIDMHASPVYTVCFLGFSPGFPYLEGMRGEIATPRRSAPRLRVAAGSVGIGGSQTGVYPVESPGGWQIIGRTPLILFDPSRESPALLQMGDKVRFRSISRDEFQGSARGEEVQGEITHDGETR